MSAKNEKLKKLIAIFLLSGIFGSAVGLSNEIGDVFDSEPLDIEGTWEQRESQADKMAKVRKNLEKKTNDMMAKKIEDIRYKEEMKLTRVAR